MRVAEVAVIYWSACFCLLLLSCNGPSRQDKTEVEPAGLSVAVRVVKPQPAGDVELAAPLSGVVRATGQVQIAFQVAGQIAEVLVEEGDTVRQAQNLALLDDRLFIAQREQAAGALAQAQAALQMAESGTRPEQIAQAEAQVAAAQARLDQVTADYQRAAQLFSEGVISRQALDAAESSLKQAQQALIAAEEQLALARLGPREEELAQARAAVQQAQGVLLQAQTQLDFATLVAPAAGAIVERIAEPGMTVSAGMPMFEIADLGTLEIRTEIPEGDLQQINEGDIAEIAFPAAPDIACQGVIASIAPSAQQSTRGFPIRIALEGNYEDIMPGMVALVKLDYIESPGGLVIPSRAIVDGKVFTVSGSKAQAKPVTILRLDGERAFVEGIELQDQVVVNGQHYISDGCSVNIVDALGIEELTHLEVK